MNNKINKLEKQFAVLEPSEQERNHLNQLVLNFAGDFLNEIEDIPAYNSETSLSSCFSINNNTHTLENLLSLYREEVIERGIVASSGNHLGYIPGGGIYASALADYLAAVSNEYTGIYYGSPGGVTIESECIEWLKRIFSFPKTAVGNLTSGGSIANLIALTAARDKFKIKNDVVVKSVIYVSPQVHHCLHKALRIIGLEDIQFRMIELDGNSRMLMADLEKQMKQDSSRGLNPFMIVASAGTTDTGSIDPLNCMADLAEKYGLWFHVDAAYGGFFVMVDAKKEKFEGMQRADSLVIDPHKGLFLPFGLGAVLIKDREAVLQSHHYLANYMQDAQENYTIDSPADLSPELTKHFRGLRLWLPLKLYGEKPFIACLEHKLLLTDYFRAQLKDLGFKLGPTPDLSISYFWYPVDESIENQFNKKLLSFIHQNGAVYLSSTLIDDKFVIRMAILSFRTDLNTIDKAVAMIKHALNDTLKALSVI